LEDEGKNCDHQIYQHVNAGEWLWALVTHFIPSRSLNV
jgi:hypothetical protein